jgi:hypothetical protein
VNVHSFAPIKEIKRKKTLQKLNLTNFHFSSSRNRLTAVGCETVGAVSVFDSSGKNFANGSCSGTGCCQAPIVQGHVISKVGYLSVDDAVPKPKQIISSSSFL